MPPPLAGGVLGVAAGVAAGPSTAIGVGANLVGTALIVGPAIPPPPPVMPPPPPVKIDGLSFSTGDGPVESSACGTSCTCPGSGTASTCV